MAKPEDSGLYTGSLLTLNANSSDEYVKGLWRMGWKIWQGSALSSFQKLEGQWVQALGVAISGVVCLDKR